ncbi:MAG: DinB family protein [Anaerolineaceae bacterium]
MNADAFRYLYDYHFSENRKLWDCLVRGLTYAQYNQPDAYSHGSIRNQIIHLMNVERDWFTELRGAPFADPYQPADGDDRPALRAGWDAVEADMRAYLAGLRDGMLFQKPIREPEEDQNLFCWQVLLHVANHATDHRAQILRQLHELGIDTPPQDFMFYVYDHPADESG